MKNHHYSEAQFTNHVQKWTIKQYIYLNSHQNNHLAGNTNINIKEDSNIQKRCIEFDLVPHIRLSTTKNTKTIDHIIINIPDNVTYSNILPCLSVSDHMPRISLQRFQRLNTRLDTIYQRYEKVRYKQIQRRFQNNTFFNSLQFRWPIRLIKQAYLYIILKNKLPLKELRGLFLHYIEEQAPTELRLLNVQHPRWMTEMRYSRTA